MAKTCVKFKSCNVSQSEAHNRRDAAYTAALQKKYGKVHYRQDLFERNEYWVAEGYKGITLPELEKKYKKMIEEQKHRRPHAHFAPIRESCVPILSSTRPEDFSAFNNWLREKFNIKVIAIALHKDEGHYDKNHEWIPNYHAHYIVDFFDSATLRNARPSQIDCQAMQDEIAKALGMERGTAKAVTGVNHLSALEYKEMAVSNHILELEQVSDELATTISDQRSESRHLNKNIKKAQKRLKGLTTMYENLLQKKEALEQQMKVLEQQLEKGAIDLQTYQNKKDSLQKEYDSLQEGISTMEEQSAEARRSLHLLLQDEVNTGERVKELQNKSYEISWEIMKQGDKVDDILKKKLKATKELLGKGWPGIDKAIEILTNPALDYNFMNEDQQTDVAKVLRKIPKERMEDVKDILAYVSEIREGITVDTKAEVVRLAARDVAENYRDVTSNFADQINDIAWALRKGTEFVSESANAIAVCLMVGYNEGVSWVASKCGGGGGQDTGGWRGKDKDEDDRQFFGRCLSAALGIIKPQRVMPQKEVPQKKGGFSR